MGFFEGAIVPTDAKYQRLMNSAEWVAGFVSSAGDQFVSSCMIGQRANASELRLLPFILGIKRSGFDYSIPLKSVQIPNMNLAEQVPGHQEWQ